jgi:hypothetical protein
LFPEKLAVLAIADIFGIVRLQSALEAEEVPHGKVYAGAPQGMCATLQDQVRAELLAFLRRSQQTSA